MSETFIKCMPTIGKCMHTISKCMHTFTKCMNTFSKCMQHLSNESTSGKSMNLFENYIYMYAGSK